MFLSAAPLWFLKAGRCPRSSPCPPPAAGEPGGCCALTAGVDAGVPDRFVLVAGRVFLQLAQDFLHRWLQSNDAKQRRHAGLGGLGGLGGRVYVWVCLGLF